MNNSRLRRGLALAAVCTPVIGITGCYPDITSAGSHPPAQASASHQTQTVSNKHHAGVGAVGAASTSTQGTQSIGWYDVPIITSFGPDSAIAGLRVQDGRLQLLIRTDTPVNHASGFVFSKMWHTAWFNPAADTVQPAGEVPAQAQATYQGPAKLVFPATFPSNFQAQAVTVDVQGKPAAKWPGAIPMYGSAANPEGPAPGTLDNQILGQVGNWLWVALKGPQYPPFYPKQQPLLWAFRHWDRLVAFNLQTGQAVEYSIPPSYTEYIWTVSTGTNLVLPTWVRSGNDVWVAVGQWVGCFPANPSPSAASGNVVRAISPVLRKPSGAYVRAETKAAIATLSSDEQELADSLASYWDTVVGAKVPGVPSFHVYQDGQRTAWNMNPAIYNHGDLPSDFIWALEFPFATSDPLASERTQLGQQILSILRNPINTDAIGMIPMTPQQVEAQFHYKPPVALPGYVIRDNAYWPVKS
ncbi:hypothetical protein [Alicyclobacillus hesperidum]|uniref:hypothetical protein n=1 Tax=Alicyclobacillus hesperidum TaxID=89784 RepID=UPI0002ED0E80|nr:hypothetical protein [Alicyclobacillus hesperidum]